MQLNKVGAFARTISLFFFPSQFRNLTKQRILVLAKGITCLVVVHPVQHDLRSPVPPGGHVPRHLIVRVPGQPEIQDLQTQNTNHCRATLQNTLHKQPGNHCTGDRSGGRAAKTDYETKFHNLWKDTRLEQRRTRQPEFCLGYLVSKTSKHKLKLLTLHFHDDSLKTQDQIKKPHPFNSTAEKHIIITFLRKYFQKELFWHLSCKGHSHGTHSNLSQTNQIFKLHYL